jgi:hypothetical protein
MPCALLLAVPRSRGSPISQHFTVPTERTPRESANDNHAFVATTIDGGLEGYAPSQPRFADITAFHGADGADAQGTILDMLVARALKNSQLTCGERHAISGTGR